MKTKELLTMKYSAEVKAKVQKMTKAQIIEAIEEDGYQLSQAHERAENMQNEVESQNNAYNILTRMFAAFLGHDIKNEYSGNLDQRKYNLLELAAQVLSCADRDRFKGPYINSKE